MGLRSSASLRVWGWRQSVRTWWICHAPLWAVRLGDAEPVVGIPPADQPMRFYEEAVRLLDLSGSEWPPSLDPDVFALRWAVLYPHILSGVLTTDDARAMLFPESGEAWARVAVDASGHDPMTPADLVALASGQALVLAQGIREQMDAEAQTLIEREYGPGG